MTKLILYTKPECHLCDEMKIVLAEVRKDFEFEVEETNIESDTTLFERYKLKIPVLMLDDKMFAKYTVDENKLRRKLLKNK